MTALPGAVHALSKGSLRTALVGGKASRLAALLEQILKGAPFRDSPDPIFEHFLA